MQKLFIINKQTEIKNHYQGWPQCWQTQI